MRRREALNWTWKAPLFALGGLAVASCGVTPEITYEDSRMSSETHKVRPLTERITEDAEAEGVEEKVLAVVQWCEKNFFHFHQDWDGTWYLPDLYTVDGKGLHSFDVSIEDVFRERAVGCHLMTLIMATMIDSIGIQVEYMQESRGEIGGYVTGHGVLYVPSVEKYVHGDHIANLVATPAKDLLLTRESLEQLSRGIHGCALLENQLTEKYLIELKRTDYSLYVYGKIKNPPTTTKEIDSILNTLAEYHPQYDQKTGALDTRKIPIERLVW